MSFVGGIPGQIRKIVAQYADEIKRPVLLPCAGNFTFGSNLRSGGYMGRLSGCDITLYTSALGCFLAEIPLAVSEKEDCPEHLRGFLDTSSPILLAASVANMLSLGRVWKAANLWHRRELARFRQDWPRLIEKTVEKLDKYADHLRQGDGIGYRPQCLMEFLGQSDPDSAVLIFPPTYGSKGYVNQEKIFGAAVDWQPPEYTEISFDDAEVYERILGFRDWLIVMDRPLPKAGALLGEPVAVVHKGRRSVISVYAAHAKKRFIKRDYPNSASPGAVMPSTYKFTGEEETGLAILSKEQSIRLNELFMSARVDYYLGDVALSLALCLDKKIIGKLDFNFCAYEWAIEPIPGVPPRQVYLRADLAVPSVEKRLAKLVLLLAQSHEVKKIVDEKLKESFGYCMTTAFTQNPVSMKYRGIFHLHKRIEDPDGYRLNYYGQMGKHSLAEGYALWLKKYRK